MNNLRQAAQQALVALDELYYSNSTELAEKLYTEAGEALRAALAEQQEPVAWMTYESKHRLSNGGNCKGAVPVHKNPSHASCVPLYTAPPPAKREPLTDEEIDDLDLPPSGTATVRDLVRLIERAHGIGEQE